MRIHRAYRQLASMLAAQGYHVLRFDYRGTGDSSGDQETVNYQFWAEDARSAAEELRAIAGIDKLHAIGARLGGAIAADLACHQRVSKLVLWEPFAENQNYFDQITSLIKKKTSTSNFIDPDGGFHFNGFHFTESFIQSFNDKPMHKHAWQNAKAKILLVSAEDIKQFAQLEQHLLAQDLDVVSQHVPCMADWNHLDELGGLFLPQNTLHEIINWLQTK